MDIDHPLETPEIKKLRMAEVPLSAVLTDGTDAGVLDEPSDEQEYEELQALQAAKGDDCPMNRLVAQRAAQQKDSE